MLDEPVGDVRLDHEEHLGSSLGDLDEDTVVDLEESEELQDLLGLRGDVVDTEKIIASAPSSLPPRFRSAHPLIRMTKKTLGWAGT